MYLTDLLFTLAPGTFVRIKFDGFADPFCFTTGTRTTGSKVAELTRHGFGEAKVCSIHPLWKAQELYIHCC